MRHTDWDWVFGLWPYHENRLCPLSVTKAGYFEITNVVDHLPRSDVVIDVKVCATVKGAGNRKAKWNANNTQLLDPTLRQAELAKYTKHQRNYTSVAWPLSHLCRDVLVTLDQKQHGFYMFLPSWNCDKTMICWSSWTEVLVKKCFSLVQLKLCLLLWSDSQGSLKFEWHCSDHC